MVKQGITSGEDIFGDDAAPAPASVIIHDSPWNNSVTSGDKDSPSSVKTKGTVPRMPSGLTLLDRRTGKSKK